MYRVVVLSGAALLAPYHVAVAEPVTADPVVVTATRTAVTADDALASVTRITRPNIEQ